MKILVTGGTGHIGSYLVMELLGNGHDVTILARNPSRIPPFSGRGSFSYIKGDLPDRSCLADAVRGMDACIHVALNYTRTSGSDVLLDDTLPAVYLADCAIRAGVKHFIYTSSTAVNDSLYSGCNDIAELEIKQVTRFTKQRPATLYGATKAACENFLMALSYQSEMRINIIRPGYTFGNPVVTGAPTEGDTRFAAIADAVKEGRDVDVVLHDGTQFIWAGDLAKVYLAILASSVARKTYLALSSRFIPWSRIAEEAIKRTASASRLVIEDRGYAPGSLFWDVSDIEKDFGLSFNPWDHLVGHIDYFLDGRHLRD